MRLVTYLAVLGFALLPPFYAQNRDTLETRVTAAGNVILVEWTKKHPWDAELLAGGGFLAAEYRTASGGAGLDCLNNADVPAPAVPYPQNRSRRAYGYGGRMANCLGLPSAPIRGRDDRVLRFRLPDALYSIPAGPVCLSVRLPNRRILPIRRSTDRGEETARFRHEPWEREAAKQAEAAVLREEIALLQAAVATAQTSVANQESNNAQKSWQNAAACQNMQVPDLDTGKLDRPVAAPEKQDLVARMVCVLRAANGQIRFNEESERRSKAQPPAAAPAPEGAPNPRLIAALSGLRPGNGNLNFVQAPGILDAILNLRPEARGEPAFAFRLAQLKQFNADWQQFRPQLVDYVKQFPKPHFGELDDMLYLQSVPIATGERLSKALASGAELDPIGIRGFVGASLEAYTRCVDDGKNQLDRNYRSAVELKQSLPQKQESIRQQLTQSCMTGIAKLDELRAALKSNQEQLAAKQRELAALTFAPVPEKSQVLNTVTCRP